MNAVGHATARTIVSRSFMAAIFHGGQAATDKNSNCIAITGFSDSRAKPENWGGKVLQPIQFTQSQTQRTTPDSTRDLGKSKLPHDNLLLTV